MNSMVETVAMALCDAALSEQGKIGCACAEAGEFQCADAYPARQARAAIEAMREPTEEMLRKGEQSANFPIVVWKAMIDAAIQNTET